MRVTSRLRRMRHGPFVLRAGALLSAGVLAVHDLRYRLGSGQADHVLEAHTHGYLSAVAPVVALLVILAAGHLLWLLARGAVDAPGRRSTLRRWGVATATLACAFIAQELVEGALTHGHPAGPAAVLGSGGWIALPLALGIGGLVALALRGADGVLRAAASSFLRTARPRDPRLGASRACSPDRAPRPRPLALRAAGRAPPVPCV